MSMQEVNLYLSELRPEKQYFTAEFCLFANICLLLGLILIYWVSGSSLQKLQVTVETLEDQKNVAGERVGNIRARSSDSHSLLLDKEVQRLRLQLEDRERVGKIIGWQNLGNTEGFAQIMTGLARHSNSEFALEKIRISVGGTRLELAGETRNASIIPLYLKNLQQEKGFDTIKFGLLSMGGYKRDSGTHSFSLGFDTAYKLVDEKL